MTGMILELEPTGDCKSAQEQKRISIKSVVGRIRGIFSGSIMENIHFFHSSPDFSRVEWAAKQAEIHDDLLAMPMGYETLIGDMGSSEDNR